MMAHIILASQSPRRRELLRLCGYPFEATAADVDENSVFDPDPAQDCILTARLKAEAVLNQISGSKQERVIIVAADTNVALDDQILGKPKDATDAKRMLSRLRGRTHDVHTGVVIIDVESGREVSGSHTAVVQMRNYTDQEMSAYVASGDPLDKAGAYAIQHPVFQPVESLDGCYLGVMGLSICHLLQLFQQIELPFLTDLTDLKRAHQEFYCPLYEQAARKQGK